MLAHTAAALLATIARLKHGGVIINEHTLSRAQTRLHLDVLGRWFDFASVEEIPTRLVRRGRRPFCVMTFDDGKRSHLTETAPELERWGVPAAFYVSTQPVSSGAPFWFDRHKAIVEALGFCPEELHLADLKQLPLAELNARLDAFCARVGLELDLQSHDMQPMSWDDVRALSRRGFTIGAHGQTHAILTREAPERSLAEIAGSIEDVARETGLACATFAFPNGNYNVALARYALACGVSTVMTTEPAWADGSCHLWQLPRIQLFPGFTPARIELKLTLAAVRGVLTNPDGTGRAYRSRRRAGDQWIPDYAA